MEYSINLQHGGLLDTYFSRYIARRPQPVRLYSQDDGLVFTPEMVTSAFGSCKPFEAAGER